MEIGMAEIADIDQVQSLMKKYHIASIPEEDKKEGFVTTLLSDAQLAQLITEENGLFIAKQEGNVVAFILAASWHFWRAWPLFEHMVEALHHYQFEGNTLNTANSYQYGPICIDKSVRGSGLLEQLFAYSRQAMSTRFEILVTFVNVLNPRSYEAHRRKLGLEVLGEFSFNNNNYYWMACATRHG